MAHSKLRRISNLQQIRTEEEAMSQSIKFCISKYIVLIAKTLPAARWPLFKHVTHLSCAPVVFHFVCVAHIAPHVQQVAVNVSPPMIFCS